MPLNPPPRMVPWQHNGYRDLKRHLVQQRHNIGDSISECGTRGDREASPPDELH
jgi:hypothetical protein